MLGRVCWGGNIGLREMVSLRDRPDSEELDWNLYGIEWAVYDGKGGILGTKNVLSKTFGSKRVSY